MWRYLTVAIVSVAALILLAGCAEPQAAVKRKRDPRYIDNTKYYGVYIGTPTDKNPSKEEAILLIRPAAMFVLKRNGSFIQGTYQYLGGEMELGVRGIDGVPVNVLMQFEMAERVQVKRNKEEGKEPDTIEEYLEQAFAKNKTGGRQPDNQEMLNKFMKEWKMYWRFTVDENGYTMKDSERGPGLYVFRRAPEGFKMPENVYSKPPQANGPRNVAGA